MAPLLKRYASSSECTTYDTTCGTHRLAIMIVIICVGLFVTGILSSIFVRSRTRRAAKERARLQQMHARKLNDPFVGTGPYPGSLRTHRLDRHSGVGNWNGNENENVNGIGIAIGGGNGDVLPPPYTPRRPERAYGAGEGWR